MSIDEKTARIHDLERENERLRGDLSESRIEVANLDMRLSHRVAEVNHLEGEVERLRARLAEAERLLHMARGTIDEQDGYLWQLIPDRNGYSRGTPAACQDIDSFLKGKQYAR